MRLLISVLCVLQFLSSFAHAEEVVFSHPLVAQDAERYAAYLRANWKPVKGRPAELRALGDRVLASDPEAASRSYASAVAADDKDALAWIGLSRALLAIRAGPNRQADLTEYAVNASGAAYQGYQRATDPAVKARALGVLGQALMRRFMWRPALDAMKISLALAENTEFRAAYEALRTEHGFRMTNYETESDSNRPRVCADFSEQLAGGDVAFSTFVSVDGKDPEGVNPEGNRLCIEGLGHGRRYQIQLRQGLPSAVGEVLEKAVDLAVYVPDRKPFAGFAGKTYVLPSRGQQGIPVVTVNTSRIAVEVYRVGDRNLGRVLEDGDFGRQLSNYEITNLRESRGQRVYQGEMDVASKLNEEVTTGVPVADAVGELKPGIYVMVAEPAGRANADYRQLATQWFIVSDLGITALTGDDGLHVFVRSLAGAEPSSNAAVRLVAKNNEVLSTGKTDDRGYVRFDAGLGRGEGGLAPAILVAENAGGDYAFLDLTTTAFDLTDRGVAGREAPGPLDAYLFTERGVYRPGETVHVTGLVRDRAGRAATLPVALIIDRPDGVEHKRIALEDQGLGGRTAALDLDPGVMTGTWRAKFMSGADREKPLTQVAFLVEDFVPQRLDLELAAKAGTLKPEGTLDVTVSGRYLYGPPGAGLTLEGDIVVKARTTDLEGYPGYKFGQADETVDPVRKPLENLPATGSDGAATIAVALPPVTRTARPLEASVLVRLRETGGRAIERSVTVPVDLGQPRIGIKPLFGPEGAAENSAASFEVVVLDGASQRVAASGLTWTLVRLDTSWQWYSRNGSWQYDSVTLTRKVAGGTFDAGAEAPAKLETPIEWGRYRLDVATQGGEPLVTSVAFNAGWHAGAESADSPEMLEVALDKATYRAGETAKVRIASKDGGKALVTVLSSGLLYSEEVDLPKGGGEVPLTVGAEWGAGAYVAALVYRPMDEAARRMPARAMGVRWLALDQSPRTLSVSLDAPDLIPSSTPLTVPVKIAGLEAGEDARVTVAAVDVGILNLTRYESPAPDRWFFSQTRLGVEIRDYYGRLIDGMRAERGSLRSGGDGGGGLQLQGNPPVEETVAFFSGIVTVGAGGTAQVEFALPPFNGTVRLMAVAWSNGKLGNATQDVIVRDAVALTVSAPRFLTLGDEARLDIAVHNVDGPAAPYQMTVDQETAAGIDTASVRLANRTMDLKPGERRPERVPLEPGSVGLHTYTIHVTGPGELDVQRLVTLDVRPPAGDVKRTTVSQLAPKGGKVTLAADLTQDLIATRTRINVSAGALAALDVPGLLSALDRYPYGCAEQTISRALPLLYANAVAANAGIAEDKVLRERVQGAVERVFNMQESSGAFGAWGPGADMWLTSYVTDFLTRAKEGGYPVRPEGFSLALDRLQNYVSYAKDSNDGNEARAYALYVLARNGRAPIGELRYWADTRLDSFATPLARAQLGAALAMLGDRERAETAFKSALGAFDDTALGSLAREDYGSSLRDHAAVVTLAAETGVVKAETPRLIDVIAKAYVARRYTSTQEQAWLLLAVNALGEQGRSVDLVVNGEAHDGPFERSLMVPEIKNGFVIENAGEAPADLVVSVVGAALTPEPAIAKGFRIERGYYTLAGQKLDFASASGGTSTIAQNERLVAVVKVTADEAGGRILLVDRLPAGLEIENPRLVDSGDVKSLDWLVADVRPEHTEFRDDRFVAAFNFFGAGNSESEGGGRRSAHPVGEPAAGGHRSATVAYIVRAVTPGRFVHPAATVEDMYRPERHARTAAGKLDVTAKE